MGRGRFVLGSSLDNRQKQGQIGRSSPQSPVPRLLLALTFTALLVVPAARAAAQDGLARAKELYTSASYDEALAVLKPLAGSRLFDNASMYSGELALEQREFDAAAATFAALAVPGPSGRLAGRPRELDRRNPIALPCLSRWMSPCGQ